MVGDDLLALLGDRIPRDHARQTLADDLAATWYRRAADARGGGLRVVDLGCGAGGSFDAFRGIDAQVDWLGVDIEDSPEVRERRRADAAFATFDGIALPVPDASVDLIFCKQVLEHVHDPGPLLADAARVLRPGGVLVGSTSQLEPFHSLSTFGYTAHGLALLLERAGLQTAELRPGIDGLTLTVRRGLGAPAFFNRFWVHPSPLNRLIDVVARARRADPGWANAAKLVFCGQFAFAAVRPPA
jgi:SAM-dependent methyltransferase